MFKFIKSMMPKKSEITHTGGQVERVGGILSKSRLEAMKILLKK